MSAARIKELLAKADCLTPLEVELRNEIGPLLDRVEMLEGALKAITDDYSERHDVTSPSTNPGIKTVIESAQAALRGEGG